MSLILHYPVKPHVINQTFGGNPDYYARFHDEFGNPEKGHMGTDLKASHGTPVYASCDGHVAFVTDAHGGEGMIITTSPMEYNGHQVTFNVINWHLCGNTDPKFPSPIPTDGKSYSVKTGDLIGHADNTGAPFESSGDHLHLGLAPYLLDGTKLYPHNGFNGCIDPEPFFNGSYAIDQIAPVVPVTPVPATPAPQEDPQVITNLQTQVSLLSKVVSLLRQLLGIK